MIYTFSQIKTDYPNAGEQFAACNRCEHATKATTAGKKIGAFCKKHNTTFYPLSMCDNYTEKQTNKTFDEQLISYYDN